jgi:hypothetical protein
MAFLKMDVGSRLAAMGGAHASIQGDASDMLSNPAGLAFVQGLDASTTVTNWIADIKHYGAAGAYRMGNLGTIGVSVVVMDYGDLRRTIPAVDADTEADRLRGYLDMGTFNVQEYAIGLGYGRQITTGFFVGGQVRYALQNLGQVEIEHALTRELYEVENELSNLVFDFGTMYYTGFRDLRFGMSVRNFSNQNDYYNQRFELPLMFDFGVAMDLLTLAPAEPGVGRNSTLTLAADWQHPRDYEERLHVGMEYGFMDTVFLRGGYRFNYDEESFTGGLGVRLGTGGVGIKADYAYGAFGSLFGQVHRVTLGVFAF